MEVTACSARLHRHWRVRRGYGIGCQYPGLSHLEGTMFDLSIRRRHMRVLIQEKEKKKLGKKLDTDTGCIKYLCVSTSSLSTQKLAIFFLMSINPAFTERHSRGQKLARRCEDKVSIPFIGSNWYISILFLVYINSCSLYIVLTTCSHRFGVGLYAYKYDADFN